MGSEAAPVRVAIAGLGPKGLFALERLLALAAGRADGGVALEVDAYEPHHAPGAGPVYDPAQPAYLRLNLAAEGVDAWLPGEHLPASQRLSFVAWRRHQGGDERDHYPPRAEVGRYLEWSLAALLAHSPPNVRVRVRPNAVAGIAPAAGGWRVRTAGEVVTYDELLIALGHQGSWAGALAAGTPPELALVPAVFPVSELSRERVPSGCTAAVRGFGLTFLDAALALTEGRGGRFERITPGGWRLRYIPSGREPAAIVPFARSGRPMLAKPLAPWLPAHEELTRPLVAAMRESISALPAGLDIERDLVPLIAATATDLLLAAGEHAAEPEAWLRAASAGMFPAAPDPAAELERSLRIAAGEAQPNLAWGLGRAWIALYPALIPRLGGDGLDERGWPVFRGLARAMERLAFGPPPINGAKLLALTDNDLVDLTHVAGAGLARRGAGWAVRSAAGERAIDVAVDAVLPEPGALGSHLGVLSELIAQNHARIVPGRRGLEVDDEGSCIGAGGEPTPGLAAIGRPTEDSVIDNDTLNRRRHPHAERWARRVLEGARRPATGPLAGAGEELR